MNSLIVIYVLFAHFVSDFIFQDVKWAVTKKDNIYSLLLHTYTYSVIIGLLLLPLFGKTSIMFLFMLYMFITHTIIDFTTSKIVGNLFNKGKTGTSIPNLGAFTMIGFDQILHYVTIFFFVEEFI